MRRASTGPTPGNASSCSALAISTSIFAVGNARFALPLGARWSSVESRAGKLSGGNRWRPRDCFAFPFPLFAPRAESTASSWASSARVLTGGAFSIEPTARSARTDAPSSATLARKRRAFFSDGVGMRQPTAHPPIRRYQNISQRTKSPAVNASRRYWILLASYSHTESFWSRSVAKVEKQVRSIEAERSRPEALSWK